MSKQSAETKQNLPENLDKLIQLKKCLYILLNHYETVKNNYQTNYNLPGLNGDFGYCKTVESIANVFRLLCKEFHVDAEEQNNSPGEIFYTFPRENIDLQETDNSIFQRLINKNSDNYKNFYNEIKIDIAEQKARFDIYPDFLKNLLYLEYVINSVLPFPELSCREILKHYANEGGKFVFSVGLGVGLCALARSLYNKSPTSTLDKGEDGAMRTYNVVGMLGLIPLGLFGAGVYLVGNPIYRFFSPFVPNEMKLSIQTDVFLATMIDSNQNNPNKK